MLSPNSQNDCRMGLKTSKWGFGSSFSLEKGLQFEENQTYPMKSAIFIISTSESVKYLDSEILSHFVFPLLNMNLHRKF